MLQHTHMQNYPFSLVAFDLDGTTIDTVSGEMHPRVQAALKYAHDHGAQVCVVSGRPLHMLHDLLVWDWVDWLLTLNGSVVRRQTDQSILFKNEMPRKLVNDVFSTLDDLNPAWFVFYESETYRELRAITYMARKGSDGLGEATSEEDIINTMTGMKPVNSIHEAMAKHPDAVFKMECSFETTALAEEAGQRLHALGQLDIARMGPIEYELTRAGVNKGSALEQLCQELKLDISRSVAFGDSGNDYSMIGRVGTFVAMANSTPKILKDADEICPSFDEQGVAVWLEQYQA